jgi:hypothetical protein
MRRWIAAVIIAIVIVAGASYEAGRLAAPKHGRFAWDVASATGTALGTMFLAVTTVGLALVTRRSVQLAQEEQRALERPAIIIEHVQMRPDAGPEPKNYRGPDAGVSQFTALFQARNVGLGPALRVRLRMEYTGDLELASDQDRVLVWPVAVMEPNDRPGMATPTWWVHATPEQIASVTRDDFNVSGDFEDRHMNRRFPMLNLIGDLASNGSASTGT